MKKITLVKTLHYKLGTTLWVGRTYLAENVGDGRWLVHVTETVRVAVLDKFILHVLEAELAVA